MEALIAVGALTSIIILLFIALLITFRFKEEHFFYMPRKPKHARTKLAAINPYASHLPEEGFVVMQDDLENARVIFKPVSLQTEDGLTLRGISLLYISESSR